MSMGMTLTHEHIIVDFRGAEIAAQAEYDAEEVGAFVLPYLQALKEAGFDTLIECTPDYLGRDPVLFRELSRQSGLKILTNTGFYPIREGKHIPDYAFTESAGSLAARWTAEFTDGIGDTGIRPGFIKIASSNAPVPEVDEKIIRAAAQTHLSTGLTINMHTGTGGRPDLRAKAGLNALRILKEEGVAPQARPGGNLPRLHHTDGTGRLVTRQVGAAPRRKSPSCVHHPGTEIRSFMSRTGPLHNVSRSGSPNRKGK